MTGHDFGIIAAFLLYLVFFILLGIVHFKKSDNLSDYVLGGRQLNPWVTSMSAEASDMSGWMLMGLPGFAYTSGIEATWIALGLALGTYANWRYVAQRLRQYTQIANDSLTLPDFITNRFRDKSNILRIVSAVFIFIFFLIYTSSGFVAGGKLFMVMTNQLFSSFLAGIILSAILAAIMSTASSQLLVTASAVSQDFYQTLIRKNASQQELVWVSRWTVVIVSILSIILALNPNSFVLDIVAYAWAGFGAAFGPTILLSLFWKRMTLIGASAGIIVGGVTVLVWKHFAWLGLYEIVPGFILSR